MTALLLGVLTGGICCVFLLVLVTKTIRLADTTMNQSVERAQDRIDELTDADFESAVEEKPKKYRSIYDPSEQPW